LGLLALVVVVKGEPVKGAAVESEVRVADGVHRDFPLCAGWLSGIAVEMAEELDETVQAKKSVEVIGKRIVVGLFEGALRRREGCGKPPGSKPPSSCC
jgi:hypothetical protein